MRTRHDLKQYIVDRWSEPRTPEDGSLFLSRQFSLIIHNKPFSLAGRTQDIDGRPIQDSQLGLCRGRHAATEQYDISLLVTQRRVHLHDSQSVKDSFSLMSVGHELYNPICAQSSLLLPQ